MLRWITTSVVVQRAHSDVWLAGRIVFSRKYVLPLYGRDNAGLLMKVESVNVDGIAYERKKDDYRTGRVNSVFSYMATVAQVLEQKKSGETDCYINFPAWVEAHGIEPRTPCL